MSMTATINIQRCPRKSGENLRLIGIVFQLRSNRDRIIDMCFILILLYTLNNEVNTVLIKIDLEEMKSIGHLYKY